MSHIYLLAGAALLLWSAAAPAQAPAGYTLVWGDEFDRKGKPDPAKWGFENGFVRNGEAQWYQPQNATVKGGHLVIEARRDRRPNPRFGRPGQNPDFANRRYINFTSASLTTKGKQSWTYGRFEFRARIKAEQGLWPALWFVGTGGRWPASGEIDLMEYYAGSILGNFAWAGQDQMKPVWNSAKLPLAQWTDDPHWDSKFHIWTMDWDEKQITLLLDGRVVNRLDLDTVRNGGDAGLPNPFRQPQHMIINLALGGMNGGPLTETKFPSRFEIDYVRVYQRTPK